MPPEKLAVWGSGELAPRRWSRDRRAGRRKSRPAWSSSALPHRPRAQRGEVSPSRAPPSLGRREAPTWVWSRVARSLVVDKGPSAWACLSCPARLLVVSACTWVEVERREKSFPGRELADPGWRTGPLTPGSSTRSPGRLVFLVRRQPFSRADVRPPSWVRGTGPGTKSLPGEAADPAPPVRPLQLVAEERGRLRSELRPRPQRAWSRAPPSLCRGQLADPGSE